MNAFIQLMAMDVERVTQLADAYYKSDIESNYVLPTFPYKKP